MVSDAKNVFLAGVGAAALTYEKATDVISQLVERGKLTLEEGKELSEELKRDVKSTANGAKESMLEKVNNIKPLTKEELSDILEEKNYATKADVLELKRIVRRIKKGCKKYS